MDSYRLGRFLTSKREGACPPKPTKWDEFQEDSRKMNDIGKGGPEARACAEGNLSQLEKIGLNNLHPKVAIFAAQERQLEILKWLLDNCLDTDQLFYRFDVSENLTSAAIHSGDLNIVKCVRQLRNDVLIPKPDFPYYSICPSTYFEREKEYLKEMAQRAANPYVPKTVPLCPLSSISISRARELGYDEIADWLEHSRVKGELMQTNGIWHK